MRGGLFLGIPRSIAQTGRFLDPGNRSSKAVDLGSGALNGSNVTNIAIYESNGPQSNIDYGLVASSSGAFVLSHMASFVPTMSLIIGLDIPLTPGKTHVVVFANQAFVNSADGQRFRTMFPDTPYSRFVDQLAMANSGSTAAQAWMMSFFQGNGSVGAIEFSNGVIPQPMTYGPVGLGLAVMGAARYRRRR